MKGQIKQFCVIVDDLDVSMKNYWELLGIGPFQKNHFTPESSHDIVVRGKKVEEPYHFCCACCWEGPMEYELIRPYEGTNIYWEHLDRFGAGMHHFKVVIPDNGELRSYMDEMEARGLPVIQTGWIDQDVHYYIDSYDRLGMIVEFGNGGAIRACTDFYPSDKSAQRKVTHRQNVKQFVLVVDDINKYMKNWSDDMGVTGWEVRRISKENVPDFSSTLASNEAEAFAYTRAAVSVGGVTLMLVQPESGATAYGAFLEEHGPGLFSIVDVCRREEILAVKQRLGEAGIGVLQEGSEDGKLRCVFDTQDEFAVVLEMAEE